MRGGALLCWLSLSAACSSGAERISIPLPDNPGGARSTLIAFFMEDGGARLLARPTADTNPIEIEPPEGAVFVEAALYFQDLPELGYDVGELELTTHGDLLPEPDFSLTAFLSEDRVLTDWRRMDGFSEMMSQLRVGPGSPCTPFEIEEIVLNPSRRSAVRWMQPLPDGRILIADLVGLLVFDEDAEPQTREVEIAPELVEHIFSGMVTESGKIYLGGETGEIWSGELVGDALEVSLVATSSPAVPVMRIDGRRDDDANPELFVLLSTGQFARYDGSSFESIFQIMVEDPMKPDFDHHYLLYIEPGEAFVVSKFQSDVIRYRSGQIILEPILFASFPTTSPGATTAAQVNGKSLVGGLGFVAEYDGRDWNPLGDTQIPEPKGIAQYGDGFLILRPGGFIEYQPQVGFCPMTNLVADDLRVARRLPSGAVLVTGDQLDMATDTRAFILRDTPAVRGL